MQSANENVTVDVAMLNESNFHADSLDDFIRHQEIAECWRCEAGEWVLRSIAFTEDWDQTRLREEAAEILQGFRAGFPAVGAFADGSLIGFATLGERLGSRGQYMELVRYHVSAPWRGRGIGRRLFATACDAARACGAERLYISAQSSKETQAAYRALGCVLAAEVDAVRAAQEPCDVQMEYRL